MCTLQKKNNYTLYIISYRQDYIGHRIELILKLKKYFEKIILVTRYGSHIDEENMIIKGYPNPFGLLRIIGLKKIKKNFENLLLFPTHKILYVWAAKRKLKKIIRNDLQQGKRISVLIPVPPHDNLLIGLALKKEYPQILWVNDWGDLWSYDEFYLHKTSAFHRKKLLKIEKKILDSSDLNITTNYWAKEVIHKKYNIETNKLRVINHPYYENDISLICKKNNSKFYNNKNLKIGFLGYLFKPPKVPGEQIVAAFHEIRKKGINVELNIYGDRTPTAKKYVKDNDPTIVVHKRTSHKKSLMNIARCDFLLLALSDLPNSKIIMHSKIPHYLLLKKPIIAIVPKESYIAELVQETGTGYVVSIDKNIVPQLLTIFEDHIKNKITMKRNEDEINKFSWNNICQQWLDIFAQ